MQIAQKTGTANPFGGSSPSPTPFRYRAVPAHGMNRGHGRRRRICLSVKTTRSRLHKFLPRNHLRKPDERIRIAHGGFSHSGGYGFNIIKWNIYKGSIDIHQKRAIVLTYLRGAGILLHLCNSIDRCGKEGPQKSLTVLSKAEHGLSSPYGTGDYHLKSTTTKYQCNNGAWTPVSIIPRGVVTLLHRPTAQIPMESRVDIPVRARPGCSVTMGHGLQSV